MKPLAFEIQRIKSEVAEIGCKTMFGKSVAELVSEICAGVAESADAPDFNVGSTVSIVD